MIIRGCAFTPEGIQVLNRIAVTFPEHILEIRTKEQPLREWVEDSFNLRLPILFVGAVGIAVRAISPFVQDKLTDSPVLVMDEKAAYVIPILAGHVGGGNRLASWLAKGLGATLVITTATDVERLFSVDVFAVQNGFRIVNREGIREVSGKLLRQGSITMAIDPCITYDRNQVPSEVQIVDYHSSEADVRLVGDVREMQHWIDGEHTECAQKLLLVSKNKVAGMGCKKGKDFAQLREFLETYCNPEEELCAIASIDLKKEEKGLIHVAQYYHIPFITFSEKELRNVEGEFTASVFVQETTGVDNVCERAAVCMTGDASGILLRKVAQDGKTLAIAQRKPEIKTWEMLG